MKTNLTLTDVNTASENFNTNVLIGNIDKELRHYSKQLQYAEDCQEINYYGEQILLNLNKVRSIESIFKARNGADRRLMLPKFVRDLLKDYNV